MVILIVAVLLCIALVSCRKASDGNSFDGESGLVSGPSSEQTETGYSSDDDKSEATGTGVSSADTEDSSDRPDTSVESTSKTDTSESGDTAQSSSSTSSSAHKHSWKAHTAKKWVEKEVTVVDKPEETVKYSIYRMYWYNTGKWEETRDPERFDTWQRDMEGGPLSPNSISMARPYEKCPLFKGYDENGHPTYTNDHTILTGYETIPAVTHTEKQGQYETYTDYYYCDCGTVKK